MVQFGSMKQRPFVIGLTGNIATGKSLVASILADLGAKVIDADRVAHDVMQPGKPAYERVVEIFGTGILNADGSIDRSRLGAIVFRDEQALEQLDAAVHPAVQESVDQTIDRSTSEVVVVEAIKLIEAGMHHHCNVLWVVTAPRSQQIQRLMDTRALSEKEAVLRVDAQPPQEEKAALADRVLVNDGNRAQLRTRVEQAWHSLPKQ